MTTQKPQLLEIEDESGARHLAYMQDGPTRSDHPNLLWLNGLNSVMTSTKVSALAHWAKTNDVGLTRFDYSGHGASSGKFTDGTIGQWLKDTIHIFDKLTDGPVTLIGSSMGGWLALLLLRQHLDSIGKDEQSRIRGLVLIAPAFDMTKDLMWMRMDDDVRKVIELEGVYMRPSAYSDEPYPITRKLIEEGQNHILGAKPYKTHCPVHILQGLKDEDVPWRHTMRLLRILDEEDMTYTLIKDAGHRLSRESDIAKLLSAVDQVLDRSLRNSTQTA